MVCHHRVGRREDGGVPQRGWAPHPTPDLQVVHSFLLIHPPNIHEMPTVRQEQCDRCLDKPI